MREARELLSLLRIYVDRVYIQVRGAKKNSNQILGNPSIYSIHIYYVPGIIVSARNIVTSKADGIQIPMESESNARHVQ